MIRALSLVALGFLAASPAVAEADVPQPPTAGVQEQTPAVAKIVDAMKSSGLKAMVYFELDDVRPEGPSQVIIRVTGQSPGSTELFGYNDSDKLAEFMQGLATEASGSGPDGWRRIVIVVEGGETSVERGPRPGPIEGAGARIGAEIDRIFPGHTGAAG